MNALDLQPFLQGFQLVFLHNLGGLISLFTKYATNLFYGIAVIEIVIAGFLVAVNSSGFYSFFFKLIKISIFFYLVIHFEYIFHLILKSVDYIGTSAALFQRDSVDTVSFSSLQHFWDFSSKDNYIYKGIKKSIELILNQAPEYESVDSQVHQVSSGNTGKSGDTSSINSRYYIGLVQLITIIMTVIIAMYYLVSFYMTALVSLLLSPFGQLSLTASLFRHALSSFIQSSIRLVVFIIVYVSFVLFTTTLKLDQSYSTFGDNGPIPGITFFVISFIGLCLCWLVPREISLYISGLVSSPVTDTASSGQQASSTLAATSVSVISNPDKYGGGPSLIQSPGANVSARNASVSVTEGVRSAGVISSAPTVQSTQQVATGGAQQAAINTRQFNNLLKKYSQTNNQKQEFSQDFTKEYVSRLRKNLHSATRKGDK